MAISYTGVMRAISNLTAPMREKVLKKLGLSTKGLPGRTSKKAGITVGKDRLKIEKKIDRYKGRLETAGVGAAGIAAYSASDFIRDILGIKGAGKGSTFTQQEKLKMKQAQAGTKLNPFNKPTVKKKTTSKITDKDLPKPRPKKKMYMKEKTGKDTKVEFGTGKAKTKLSTGGALKKPTPAQKGLQKLPTAVRNKMGYMKKGGSVTKKKSIKANKGVLVLSIGVGKMKKKPTTKKKK